MKTFLIILSFLFPIVGVIAYFANKNKDEDAGVYLGAAGAGFVAGIVSTFLF